MRRIDKDTREKVSCTVNDQARVGWAEPRMQLVDFIRHELGLFGTHVGCEHGVCGACTISFDGVPTRACLTFAVQAEGAEIKTVESLSNTGLHPLQDAFKKYHALQCGFCTAGILMSSLLFIRQNPMPSERDVREMLSGHICRCTGYDGMVKAILEVSQTGTME